MSDTQEEANYVEDEAEEDTNEEENDEGSSEDSEEEEDQDDNIADLIDDGHDGDDDDDRPIKKRHRKKVDDRLDDEDYDVIRENTGIDVPKKRKFRRVQMFDSDEEDAVEERIPVEDVFGGSDDDDDNLDDNKVSHPNIQDEERSEKDHTGYYDDEDIDGFIVGDDGLPIGQRKNGIFSEPALLEAQDIFGFEFNPEDFGLGSDEEDINDNADISVEKESDSETDGKFQSHRKKSRKHRSIYDVYEPSELERSHFTDKDKMIRVIDVPERFQLRSISVQNTEEGELDFESDWIYHQAFCNPPVSRQPHYYPSHLQRAGAASNIKSPSAIPKIKEALNFIRNYSFDVPFIATYRREYVEPELDVHDLWKVLHWDEKWMQLQQRKRDLKKLFKRMQEWQLTKVREEPEKALTEDYRTLEVEDIARLESVQTEEELSDVYTHFMLYYGRDLIVMKNKTKQPDTSIEETTINTVHKQAKRQDFYAICQEAGLGALASKFGLTSEQFGENLRDNYQRHETEQYPYEPEEAAQEFIQHSGYFSTVRSVLQGACHMVAMQIACEPLVRQVLRQVYQTRGMVNVSPTKKGKKIIDESHPCFSAKYLKNKPVREFKGDEFLILSQAETDGLLSIKITIDIQQQTDRRKSQGLSSSTFLEEIRMLFYRDEFSMLVEKWNAQRAQSVAQALMKVLYPQMDREIRRKLLNEAKEHVIQCCVLKFRSMLNTGGFNIQKDVDESENGHRVMAVTYSDDWSIPSFTCFLNGNGEVSDYFRLDYIHKKVNMYNDVERIHKEDEIKKIKQALTKQRPDVVVVSAESRSALLILDEFKACINDFDLEHVPLVQLMDPCVAKIYANTNRAKDAFPTYPSLLLSAISLARYAQEPLSELAALCESPDEELLALRLHPLQMAVSQEQLKHQLEVELVIKINEVGVDINFCIEHPHAESMLSFVSGFGSRKATGLLKILRQENIQLQNRSQLVTQCSIGPQVFINCAGFIKVSPSTFTISDSTYIEILDSTRIHPETYEWARKMAVDALEYDETGDESNPSAAVEDVMETPEKLQDLDLDAFADELQRQEYGNKRATLYDIRNELFAPFKDGRKPFSSISPEEKFALLIGESIDSIYEGKLITCTVTGIARKRPQHDVIARANPIQDRVTGYWQCPFCLRSDFPDISLVWSHFDDNSCPGQGIGVRTRLENGLNGFISTKNLSDNQVNNPEEKVQPGMTVHCRVLSVNAEKFSVDLSCRSSDLIDKQGKFGLPKDLYYDYAAADIDKKKDEASNKKPKQRYFKRVIVHPSFMNVSFSEAQEKLMKMDQGDAIFRPSSQSQDQLTLTWKVTDTILQHVNIKEEGKPNAYSLGKSLIIANEEYEDFDEILARFVQPIAANTREILSHKCYRESNGGDRKILERLLNEEKSRNPRRIPYFFTASKHYPGKIVLAYQPSSKPKFEFITVVPEGFRYRGQTHMSLLKLINWFKENFSKPIRIMQPTPDSHTRSVHSTPMSMRGQAPYTPSQWAQHTSSPSITGQNWSSR